MRYLMYFTIGFALACLMAAYDLVSGWTGYALLGCVFACILFLIHSFKFKALRRGVVIFLGCTVGFLYFLGYQQFYLKDAIALDGQTQEVLITATDYSVETEYGVAVEGDLELDGNTVSVYAYINEKLEVSPGDRLIGPFRFRLTTAQSAQGQTYHQGRGIFLLAYARGSVKHRVSWDSDPFRYPAIFRRYIEDNLKHVFPKDVFGFTQALFLGNTDDLSYSQSVDFQRTGISHVVSVSGLHISILYGLIGTVTFRKRFLTPFIAIPALGLFAAVVGFTPSVTRSCLMMSLFIIAEPIKREYDAPTALAFSSLIMIVVNPMVVTNVSFQLSVSCVAGMLLFQLPIYGWLERNFGPSKGKSIGRKFKRGLYQGISVSLAATALTLPLTAIYFGSVSVVALLTNLMTLWIINSVFTGIGIAMLISLVYMPAAVLLGEILAWPIRFVLWIVHLISKFPLAAVYTESTWVILWLILLYLLLAVLLLQKKKQTRLFAGCTVAGLCISIALTWILPGITSQRLTVLDVGQGQCLLLETKDKNFLIDCGGDSDRSVADLTLRTLYSRGITKLDGVFLTHMDQDHIGGACLLLQWMETDLLVYPATNDPAHMQLLDQMKADRRLPLTKDWRYHATDLVVQVYTPGIAENENEKSLWILFNGEKYDILITGDATIKAEQRMLKRIALPQVDVLIAGHHGDGNSTSRELLKAANPKIVMISVGEDNHFGHPDQELLHRLVLYGCRIYRTDRSGTIIYEGE